MKKQRRKQRFYTIFDKLAMIMLAFAIAAVSHAQAPTALRQIESVTVRHIGTLTGPDAASSTRPVDICGTDIGTMAELDGKVYFAFGDTFGFRGNECPRFGPNWRSNALAASSDLDPSDGVSWDWWLTGPDGNAIAVTEGAHQPAFTGTEGEQTRIPTAMVAVDNRLYLHYMSVHGFAPRGGEWTCNFSRFLYSDNQGQTWTESAETFGDRESNFNMLALTNQAGQGNEDGSFVYALGTPCGRFDGVKVGRVLKDRLLELDAWEYYAEQRHWSADRGDAVEIIPAPVGEGSILWNPYLGRWMYTYLNEHTASIELREAKHPWGPWSEAHTLVQATDYPQLYGAYMTPSYLKNDGRSLYFIMSMFGPYNVFIMEATLEK